MLRPEDKKAIVEAVHKSASTALSAVVADYRGLSVGQMTELRSLARDQSVYVRVVRNTLARRAFQGTSFECLDESLVGPTLIALSLSDPGAAARIFKEFGKKNEKLQVRALSIGGKVYGNADIDVLASLPTYSQAISQLLSVIQAPVAKVVQVMHAVPTKLVRTLVAIKEQKEAASAA